MQSSHQRQFDDEVSTYHSAKSSIMHGPVRRKGGRGRRLLLQSDISPPLAGSMPPPSQVPLRRQARTPSRPPRQGGPMGQLADGMSFAGVLMGPSTLPPLVQKTSPTIVHSWAAQPGVLAQRGSDTELIAGSAGEESRRRWPPPAIGPRNCLPFGPPRHRSDSESSSQQESTSTRKCDLRRRSRRPRRQRRSDQFGPQGAMFAPPGLMQCQSKRSGCSEK